MIIDTLNNLKFYKQLNENFAIAIDFINSHDLSKLPLGKTIIEGENVFCSNNEYTTKSINEAKWEAHKIYADIQLLISGEEYIGFSPIDSMKIVENYNKEKDVLFLEGHGEYILMEKGKFAIFLPQDAHQPCVLHNNPTLVRKIVVKIKL